VWCVAAAPVDLRAAADASGTAATNAAPADPNLHTPLPMARGAKLAVLGTGTNPWRSLNGTVAKLEQIDEESDRISFRTVAIPATMKRVFYRGRERVGGLAKVKEGKVGEVTVGGVKLELNAAEIPEGAMDTKALGTVRVMFRTPMDFDEGFFLILTDKQLADLRELLKKGPTPATPAR
jgi:hypothetical protein